MSVSSSDIIVLGSANMPENDSSTSGGAIDTATKIIFTDIYEMAKTFTNIASNFSGTHEDLMKLMSDTRTQKSPNNLELLLVLNYNE